jgi:hypothetical protein
VPRPRLPVSEDAHTELKREKNRRNAARFMHDPAYREKWNAHRKAHARKMRSGPETWARHILPIIRDRSTRTGVPFSITAEDIPVPENCPVFNKPLVFAQGAQDFSPSVDRRRPALGYVPGNVVVISRRANAIKYNAETSDEVQAVADWMRKQGL